MEASAGPRATAVMVYAVVLKLVVVRIYGQYLRLLICCDTRIADGYFPGLGAGIPGNRQDAVRRAAEVVILSDADHRIVAAIELRAGFVKDVHWIVRVAGKELGNVPPDRTCANLIAVSNIYLALDGIPGEAVYRHRKDAAALERVDCLETQSDTVAVRCQILDDKFVKRLI